MFKKKTIYQTHSKNNKLRDLNTNNSIFRTINIPYQHSCFMNSSEPILLRPSNNDIAFLMTPCYIVNDNEDEYKTIKDYRDKFANNNIINKSYLTSRHKVESMGQSLNNSMKQIFDNDYFTNSNSISVKRKYETNGIKNNMKKISFHYGKYEIYKENRENKSIKNITNKRKNNELKRPISTDRIKKNKFNNLLNHANENDNDNMLKNNRKNNLIIGEDNYIKSLKNKIVYKNKNKSCIINKISSKFLDKTKDKNFANKINREIFSHLYNNNYLNNLKKLDVEKISKKKKNARKSNIFGINTERMQKKNYSLLGEKENLNPNYAMNDSHDLLFSSSISNEKKFPYNKIIKNEIFSSNDYSLNNSSHKNKKGFIPKDIKKINKESLLNIYSNNSNSRSKNQNLNQSSTNFTSCPFNKEYQKIKKNKKEENSIKKNIKNESGSKSEFSKNSSEKNSYNSNRISLQTISDSKILELAGNYGLEDSSTENYQMNNVIYNKNRYNKKSN